MRSRGWLGLRCFCQPRLPRDQSEAGTENTDATLNWDGGSNYLITIPVGQSADVQIYNPAFAPDTCGDGSTSVYCYHENDTSFSGSGAPASSYSAMEYTVFSAATLSSRSGDTKISQEVFYPYNATGLASSPSGTCSGSKPYSLFYFNPPNQWLADPDPAVRQHDHHALPRHVSPVGFRSPVRADPRI